MKNIIQELAESYLSVYGDFTLNIRGAVMCPTLIDVDRLPFMFLEGKYLFAYKNVEIASEMAYENENDDLQLTLDKVKELILKKYETRK